MTKPKHLRHKPFTAAEAKVLRRYLRRVETWCRTSHERCAEAAKQDPTGSMAANAQYWKNGLSVTRWAISRISVQKD